MGNLSLETIDGNQANNYIDSNTADDQLDLAMSELRQVDVSANVDWSTGDEQVVTTGKYKALRTSIIEFTGAQGAGRTFTVPANKKWYLLLNSCTGGFNTTFKTITGTGITVANGAKKKVFCNGSEIIDWTGV
jgi:hypothetical protein